MAFKKVIQRAVLPAVVFITGACILVVEVLATRVLAPYFGGTIYTVSSVIGVVLGALSLGYYLGGRIADARPLPKIFYGLIAAGGVSVFLLEALLLFVMPLIGYRLPMVSGSLISSLALFFIPSALLGCLSPFAITLQKERFPAVGVGTLSGEIFFWSTLGSIVGSLGSGFLLIPAFGVHTLFMGVGALLVLLGGAGVCVFRSPIVRVRDMIAVLVVLVTIPPALSASADAYRRSFLYLDDGVYERIAIYDGSYQGRPARFLEQDRSSSSAMFLDSDELVFDYTAYYALAGFLVPEMRHTLVLGAGAYSVPKAILADYPNATVDVVDIEPKLFSLSKKFFRLPDDARLTPFTTDARRFLRNPPHAYDLIFSDIYSSLYALPVHTSTKEFFESVKASLAADGVFIANVIGSLSREEPSLLFSLMRTMETQFDNTYYFAVRARNERAPQNIIFVGVNGKTRLDFSSDALRASDNPLIRELPGHWIDPVRYDRTRYAVFTDVHAPVERATQKLFAYLHEPDGFSGEEALALTVQQVSLGPRALGLPGHARVRDFIEAELRAFSDNVLVQEGAGDGVSVRNIIARFHPEKEERVIVATHYDTNPTPPTPGANNGASGVAVLLELARVLALHDDAAIGVDLIFFDAEEGAHGAQSSDWRPLGSEYFAMHLDELYKTKKPRGAIVIDMVCERGADIRDRSDDIRDDHTALQAAGIPATLLIDYEYQWNYSLHDTPDKCSAKSLQAVGDALLAYLPSL